MNEEYRLAADKKGLDMPFPSISSPYLVHFDFMDHGETDTFEARTLADVVTVIRDQTIEQAVDFRIINRRDQVGPVFVEVLALLKYLSSHGLRVSYTDQATGHVKRVTV
jgi:hypothetical protein